MTNIHGIIGWPLGHTLSPALHNFGFRSLGIDATYEAWPTRPADLGAFMHRVREEGIRGVSVTIPHKRAVMEHLDELTYRAKSVGAVNTLFWEDGRLCGENTDISGLAEPLRKIGSLPESALILGAGGAARAAAAALRELGVSDVAVTNRTRSRADVIAHDFAVRAVDWEARMDAAPGLIINTTPLGMSGEMVDATPWEADRFPEGTVVYDIVYNPLRTKLLNEAEEAGCRIVEGLEMFLHQGLAQFRLWTGRDLDEAAARELLLAELG
ncbi:shikimate dehydrogenase [Salidesulfovibrio brasiliensis]